MENLKCHTPDLTAENVSKLAALFPNCVVEVKDAQGKLNKSIDFDQLRQELSTSVVDGPRERYHLDWPGKREALLTANAPIAKTLRPCPKESINFDTTQNLFIEGDNLDALKLLQETYLGKVKMIYIDPPYNTGNDLLYEDDFADDSEAYFERSKQRDETGNRLIANTEANGRFHSDWLSMMLPRLKLARNLLIDSGLIFISIGEAEVTNMVRLCDEIMGAENFIGLVPRSMKGGGNKGTHYNPVMDYVVTYAKSKESTESFTDNIDPSIYTKTETEGPRKGQKYAEVVIYMPNLDPMRGCKNQRYYIKCPDGSFVIPPGEVFPKTVEDGSGVAPKSGKDKVWRWTYDTFRKNHLEGRVAFKRSNKSKLVKQDGTQADWILYQKRYYNESVENETARPNNLFLDFQNMQGSQELAELNIPFDYPKPTSLIKHLMFISKIRHDDLVLDFFAGSGSTAHAVMALNAEDGGNRRCISVQLPEPCGQNSDALNAGFKTIADIAKERMRRAGEKLRTDLEIQKQQAKEGNINSNIELDLDSPLKSSSPYAKDSTLDVGFRVLKVDTSNLKDVYYAPDAVKQTDLVAHADNIKEDRSPEDLLFQVLVDWGVDLALPISKETIAGKTVFFVDGNALAACFDAAISEDLVKELAKRKPLRAVFRDNSYGSDSVKINVEQIFKLLSPATEIKSL